MGDDVGDEEVSTPHGKKPRRVDEHTVTYLVALETQLAVEGVSEGLSEEDRDLREALVTNVLSELSQCTASVACDRRTNVVLEKLCYHATLPQLVELMRRFTPYSVFLARQRHASHVFQALIARLCYVLKHEGISSSVQDEVDEDSLQQVVLALATPVLKETSWLAKELSASHVIRSLLCCLAGMPCVSERKGKDSKHQHSVSLSETMDNLLEPKRFYIAQKVLFYVPSEFKEALGAAAATLLSLNTAQLQDLVADSSSCAVLSLFLRLLYTPDLLEGGAALAERIVRSTLQWPESSNAGGDDDESGAAAAAAAGANPGCNVFYGMAGDKSASHFLEAVLECCRDQSAPPGSVGCDFLCELVRSAIIGGSGRAGEYGDDPVGNFVLQAALRRLSAELEWWTASSGSGTSSAAGSGSGRKAQRTAVAALESVSEGLLSELAQPTVFTRLALNRGGVCLWLLELSRWVGQRGCSKGHSESKEAWADVVGEAMLLHWLSRTSTPDSKLGAVLAQRLAPLAKTSSSSAPSRHPGGRGGHDKSALESAQLLLARQLGAVLQLPAGTLARESSLEAVAALPGPVAVHICTHGPMSRAVMDPFLAAAGAGAAEATSSSTPDHLLALLRSCEPHLVDIGNHFIGRHVLRVAFENSGAAGKQVIVKAVHSGRERLGQSKEGKATLRAVQADLYARQPQEWLQLVHRQTRARALLESIEGTPKVTHAKAKAEDSKTKGAQSSSAQQTQVAAGVEAGAGAAGGGRKRKRKRKKGVGAGAAGGDGDGGAEDDDEQR